MRIRWFIIIAVGLIGAVWIGQGLGIIRGSGFMTDDLRWALVGVALVAVAVVFGVIQWRRQRA